MDLSVINKVAAALHRRSIAGEGHQVLDHPAGRHVGAILRGRNGQIGSGHGGLCLRNNLSGCIDRLPAAVDPIGRQREGVAALLPRPDQIQACDDLAAHHGVGTGVGLHLRLIRVAPGDINLGAVGHVGGIRHADNHAGFQLAGMAGVGTLIGHHGKLVPKPVAHGHSVGVLRAGLKLLRRLPVGQGIPAAQQPQRPAVHSQVGGRLAALRHRVKGQHIDIALRPLQTGAGGGCGLIVHLNGYAVADVGEYNISALEGSGEDLHRLQADSLYGLVPQGERNRLQGIKAQRRRVAQVHLLTAQNVVLVPVGELRHHMEPGGRAHLSQNRKPAGRHRLAQHRGLPVVFHLIDIQLYAPVAQHMGGVIDARLCGEGIDPRRKLPEGDFRFHIVRIDYRGIRRGLRRCRIAAGAVYGAGGRLRIVCGGLRLQVCAGVAGRNDRLPVIRRRLRRVGGLRGAGVLRPDDNGLGCFVVFVCGHIRQRRLFVRNFHRLLRRLRPQAQALQKILIGIDHAVDFNRGALRHRNPVAGHNAFPVGVEDNLRLKKGAGGIHGYGCAAQGAVDLRLLRQHISAVHLDHQDALQVRLGIIRVKGHAVGQIQAVIAVN